MASQRIPPHSDEAEKSVLGAFLIDKETVSEVVEFLRPEHFYNESHGLIYQAVLDLYELGKPVDLVTLSESLRSRKALKKVGGSSYLTELASSVPTAANVSHYAQIVVELAVKRMVIRSASILVETAFDETVGAQDIIDKAEREIFGLSQKHTKSAFMAIREALAQSFDRLDELHKSSEGLRGVPTGFKDLDDTLAGMQESNLLVLAGRPGLGKTAFALNIAQHVAVTAKIPVGFFSLEMSREELVDRLLVNQADIDAWRLKTGKLTPEDFEKLSNAMGLLAEAPLFIDDSPGLSVLEMRTKARRLMSEVGLKLLIVDYLQLAVGRKLENRVQEVTEISQGLKNLARELKIPIMALSQLSRAVEHRGTKIPQLADLRESGAIEQDADVVMFIFREDEEDVENVKLSVAKHRNGPLRLIDFRFKGDRIRFYGVEKRRHGEE
jgi:replicative DNA helicase